MSVLIEEKEKSPSIILPLDALRYVPKDESTINYGALAKNLPNHRNDPFYVATAIAYTNGFPHIGHAYEFINADVIGRYFRLFGYDTIYCTGSDEHGQKVANSAEANGRTPKEHCDLYVNGFKTLNQRLAISNDIYIRTTDEKHEECCKKLWQKSYDAGDIYLDSYEGWYNEREEAFVTETDAEATNFLDPGNGLPLKRVSEQSYFFRMSKYCERLITHMEENPSFVEPEQYRNNILARLKKDGLRDLSISRTTFEWGIKVPEGFDSKHVMYVWFDALSNYLSAVNGLDPDDELSRFWPTNMNVVGKDIIWFHCVIWPCMLMSTGLPLPGGIMTHGFVNAEDGRKMSKSYGNTVDPLDMLDKFPSDSLRYFFCNSVTYGADINFSEQSLIQMHNSELADILGNLVHRAVNLCEKYCDGKIPDVSHDSQFPLPFDIESIINGSMTDMKNCPQINLALYKAMEAARATNRFLTEAEPWKMKGDEHDIRRKAIVRTTLEAIYAFMHFLAPVIPIAADSVFKKFNTEPVTTDYLKRDFYNLTPGTTITIGEILFTKIEKEPEFISETKKKATKVVAPIEDPNQDNFTKVELRVGKITKVWNHAEAERLYCEEVDIGEETVRPIASGLRANYSIEELVGRLVIVVCNLNEAKMKGFVSKGMVLASKSEDGLKVELVNPPEGSIIGERLTINGLSGEPLLPNRMKKLKIWEIVMPDLKVNNDGIACWQDQPLQTSTGVCNVLSNRNTQIS